MIISPTIILAMFVVVAVAIFLANFASARTYLFVVGFVFPLYSINQIVGGINVMWHGVLGPLSLLLLVLAPTQNFEGLKERRFWLFLVYTAVVTTVWMILEYSVLRRYVMAQTIGLGPGQTIYKMPVQLASLTFQMLAFFIIPTRARDVRSALAAFQGYLTGCLVSLAAGVVMVITTGTGYVEEAGAGVFDMDGMEVVRIGGLSAEPKNLGAFLVMGLALVASVFAYERSRKAGRRLATLFVIMVVGLFVTYSTSSWVGFAAMMLFLLALIVLWRKPSRQRVFVVLILAGALVATQSPYVGEVLEERVERRLVDEESSEVEGQKDNFVWDIYADKPHHAVWGFGYGGTDLEATPYMFNDPAYRAQLNYVRTPTPATNGMRLFGDIGLLGLALFGAVIWTWSRRLREVGEYGFALFVVVGFVGLMFISINAIPAYLFLCGGAVAIERMRREAMTSTPLE